MKQKAKVIIMSVICVIIVVFSVTFAIIDSPNYDSLSTNTPAIVEKVDADPAPADAGIEEQEVAVAAQEELYTTTDLNMRTEPSLEGDIVQVLSQNTKVIKIGDEGDWSKIQWSETETYYVSSKYLSTEETPIVVEQKQEVQTYNTVAEAASNQGSFTGYITHYGPDCAGCGGTTATGYNVSNTIYYNDATYGQVRIVALSKNYPLYSIIRINNYKYGSITAIVLDRGGAITGNKIDLLVGSESEASNLGIQTDAYVEILRWGA